MKRSRIVFGLFCGLLVSSSARADCHDPRRLARSSPTPACRQLVDAYASVWTTGKAGAFDDLFAESAQLSGMSNYVGKAAVLKRLKEELDSLGGQATYKLDRDPNGGHLKVGGFLWFGRTELENVAELRWKAKITPKDSAKTPRAERVTAILLRTKPDLGQPWQFLSLRIERK